MTLVLQLWESWKRQVRVIHREEGEGGRRLARITDSFSFQHDLACGGHGARVTLGEGMRYRLGMRGEPAQSDFQMVFSCLDHILSLGTGLRASSVGSGEGQSA